MYDAFGSFSRCLEFRIVEMRSVTTSVAWTGNLISKGGMFSEIVVFIVLAGGFSPPLMSVLDMQM